MREERLFEALGLVDDRLVEEAADARRTAVPWHRWAATAACMVAAIGLGSLTFGVMFRGCGAKDGAPAMNQASTESAADTAGDAGADGAWLDAPVEAPADAEAAEDAAPAKDAAPAPEAPADTPAETPSGGAGLAQAPAEGIDGIENAGYDLPTAPVLTLEGTAQTPLTVRRDLTLDVEADGAHAAVTDRYTLENPTDRDRTVTLSYPFAGSLDEWDEAALALTLDGRPVSFETEAAPADDASWTAGEVPSVDLSQTVTVWRFADVDYDATAVGGGAELAVFFDAPAGTQILSYGCNGRGTLEGQTFYDYFLHLAGQPGVHEVVFLGEAPETWTVRGYADGSFQTPRSDITARIEARTMTLGDYLGSLTGSDLERECLAQQLAGSDEDSPMLEALLRENRTTRRRFAASFRVTVPAGGSVTLEARYRRAGNSIYHSGDETDLARFGYEAWISDEASFVSQTARTILPAAVTVVAGDLPTERAETLEPGIYTLDVRRNE